MPTTRSNASKTTASKTNVWSREERAAMREGARERKPAAKASPAELRAAGEAEIRAKIAELPEDERKMGERLHALVSAAAPALMPRTYYGMPAYAQAGKDGKVLFFFQPKAKFKVRYLTFGFQHDARIDAGEMWPVAFAVMELTPAAEARIVELVKKAAAAS